MTGKRIYRSLLVTILLVAVALFYGLKSGSFAIGHSAATGASALSAAAPFGAAAVARGNAFGTVNATATVTAPATVPLGQSFNFDVQFANTSGVIGYGPYVNLFMPSSGVDGNDGYTFNGATYLGAPVTTTTLSCPSGGSVVSPVTGLSVSCPITPSGQPSQLIILQLPFGSVTVGQMLAPLQVSATMSNLADVGTPLPISASAGFIYGDSPTGSMPSQGATNTANVTPSLLMMTKIYNGPENETATGPNYPRSYTLTPSMPPGLTATNVMVTDTLPDNIVYLGVTGAGFTINIQPPTGTVVTAPNNQLKVTYTSFTGAASPVTVNFYVAQNNSGSASVVNPTSGAPGTTVNQAAAMGTWTPVDPRDGLAQTVSATSGTVTITDRSLAIQKSVNNATPPASPGDVLTYRLDFQVSDFFTMKSIIVTDTLGDGQDYNPGSVSLNVTDRNGNVTGTFPAGNFTVQNNVPAAGQTKLTFDVSAAMVTLGAADGTLQGGRAILPNAVAAQGFITFTATIRDTYKVPPMGPLLSGDTVSNSTIASGDVVPNNNITAPPTGTITDGSSASVVLVMPTLQKSAYAINGNTTIPNPFRISPGDQVTFRLTYNLPSGDYRSTAITDTLPLPMFKAETLTNLAFNNTNAGLPATGNAQFGPTNSGAPLVTLPTITVNPSTANNQITFTFPDNTDASNTPTTIDLLFTLTATADPFVDPLLFTNQANAQTVNSAGEIVAAAVVSPLVAAGPKLKIRKGVVATDNSAGVFAPAPPLPANVTVNPANACAMRLMGTGLPVTSASLGAPGTVFDSGLTNVDAADQVTYAIVVENSGSGLQGAFNVSLTDTIPAGSTLVPGSVCANNGAGAALAFIGSLPGSITLTDPSATQGALTQGVNFLNMPSTTGTNLAIITYTVTLNSNVTPRQNIDNTATITNYAAVPGGPNFASITPAGNLTDTSRVTIADPQRSKMLLGTEIANTLPNPNGLSQAVIGELMTYRVTVTIPEGITSNVSIADTLPAGLAFVDVTNFILSPGVSANAISTGTTPSNTAIANNGRNVTFNLGNVTNANTDNSVAETLTIEYRAVVLNVIGNQGGTTLTNSAIVIFNGNSLPAVSAAAVTVIEPQINTSKTISIAGSAAGATANGDAGDAVTFVITLTHAANSPDAFDATLSDPIPAAILTPMITTVVDSASVYTAANFQIAAGTLQTTAPINLISQPTARTITITVTGTLAGTVMPGQSFPNTATTRWTSLNGLPGLRSTYNTGSTERTGADGVGGALNDYASSATATATIFPTEPLKTLVKTSESHTNDPSVAIGEIARYRLRVRLPEGSATNFQLKDNLPVGLQFLNDSTAKYAFVSTSGTAISSDTLTSGSCGFSGDETTVDNFTPNCLLPDDAVSDNTSTNSDSYATGTDPFFKFGNLMNSESDLNKEFILVEFNALVLNEAGNVRGTNLDNNFSVLDNGVTVATSPDFRVTVVEPLFTITKTPSIVMGDAGDMVKYTVVYANNGTNASTAFETRLLDMLPAFLTLNTASVMPISAGSASPPINNSAGNTVDINVASIPTGGSVTVMYSATINANAPAGLIISNTANLTYSSLPGAGTVDGQPGNMTGTTTPGASGAANGERNGTGGVNNYAISASTSVMVKTPTLVKLAPSPTSYAIGETVTYNILVTLPEGETRALNVMDDLPAGMSYVSSSIIASAAASGGVLANNYNGSALAPVLTPGSPVDGDVLNFAFGTVTTAADNDATTNQFIVRVVARVNNVSGNVNATSLTNVALANYTNPNTNTTVTTPTSSQTVTVKEPRLQVVKSVNSQTPDCGARLTYTLVISHTAASTATAFDVALSDMIPAGLTYVGGSLMASGTPAPSVSNESAGTINVQWTSFPLNSTVTITYQADVPNCPPGTDGQMFNNTANLNWTSLAGADPNERTGAGGINNYSASSSAKATITRPSANLGITKNDGVTSVNANGTTTYTITVTNAGPSPANGAIFRDPVAAGINATSVACGSVAGGATCPTPGNTTVALMQGVGIVIPVLPSGGSVTFTVMATITATSGSVTNTVFINPPAGTIDPTPGNDSASDTDTVTPVADLAISKTDGSATYTPGGTTTYTIVVTNLGPSAVTGATVTDTFPAAITSASWTCAASAGSACGAANGTGNILTTVNLLVNGTATYIVTASIAANASGNLVNTAAVAVPAGTTDPTPGNNSATDTDTANPTADLSITKTDGSASYTPGGATTYTIVVTNNGLSNVTNASVTDTFPAAVTSAAWTCVASGGSSCGAANGTGNISTTVSLLLNGTATYTVVAQISPGATGNLVNTATVTNPPGTTDPTPGNNSATDTDTPAPSTDLSITKTDGSTSYTPGGAISYTIVVANAGPSNASGVSVADAVPASITGITVNCVASGTASCGTNGSAGNNVSFTGASITAGAGNFLTITVSGTINAATTGSLINTATVTPGAGQTDPNNANNTATDTDTNNATADLAITKTDSAASYIPGTSTTYTIVVTNNGPSAVNNASVMDTLPAGISSATWTCLASAGGNCDAANGTGSINTTVDLNPGATATFTVNAQISAAATGNLVNTATVATPPGVTDPTPGNNSATDTDTPNAQTDLAITKTDGSATYTAGNAISYTIVVSNNGPSNATGASVADTIPAAITGTTINCVASGSANCGTNASAGNALSFTGVSIAAGAGNFITLTVSGTVNPATTGNLVNTATATPGAGQNDPTPGNNSATDTDTPSPQTDLAITKTDGSATYTAGTAISYTIVVSNNGPSNATGASVADTIPASITGTTINCVASGTATCGTNASAGNALSFTGVNINSGAGNFLTITVSGTVSAGTTGNLVNTATVTAGAGQSDPTPGNNSATDTDTPNAQTDLSITKTDGSTTYTPGGAITYTIVVANTGPSNATGVSVADAVPASITGTTINCAASGTASCGTNASSGNNVSFTGVSISAGVANFLTITVSGTINPATTGTLINTATVTPGAGQTDPNNANNTATDTDSNNPQADLAVTKTDGSATYIAGTSTTYTIVVTNNGPSAVNNASVVDNLPAGISSAAWTCLASAGGNCDAANGTGSINTTVDLAPGATATFTVVAQISASATGNLVNTAMATPPPGVTDPTPGNNSATDSDTPAPVADLSITKTDGSATYTPGSTTSYTIVVSNAGPSAVVNAPVADTFPAAITSATWTCSASVGSSCGANNGAGSIATTVSLLPGGTASFTVTAQISAAAAGNLVNTATVATPAGTTDPTPGNNSATDTDTPAPVADLSVTKTDNSAIYTAGNNTVYTMVVGNNGPSNITGATVTDTMPAGQVNVAAATWTCVATAGSACGAANGTGNIATTVNLAVGGTATFTYTVPVLAGAVGNLTNTVTVAPPAGATDPNNRVVVMFALNNLA